MSSSPRDCSKGSMNAGCSGPHDCSTWHCVLVTAALLLPPPQEDADQRLEAARRAHEKARVKAEENAKRMEEELEKVGWGGEHEIGEGEGEVSDGR